MFQIKRQGRLYWVVCTFSDGTTETVSTSTKSWRKVKLDLQRLKRAA